VGRAPPLVNFARPPDERIREQGLLDPARLVFIDETSANTQMVRLYGHGPRGVRLVDHVPLNRDRGLGVLAVGKKISKRQMLSRAMQTTFRSHNDEERRLSKQGFPVIFVYGDLGPTVRP
jgi:hypothetical protein